MNIGINLVIENTKNEIRKVINGSGLPTGVSCLILQSILREAVEARDRDVQAELAAYRKEEARNNADMGKTVQQDNLEKSSAETDTD